MKSNKSHSLRRPVFLGISLFFFSFLVAEILLRLFGEVPGFTGPTSGEYLQLKNVKELVSTRYFSTDSSGLFKANPDTVFYDSQIRINPQGFRGRALVPNDSVKKKTVLFIGDSFTWGGNADPISECFVDLVERAGFYTWNTGIPGAEPNQYAEIADRYVPLLKPQFVVITFYMVNDVMWERQALKPFQNKYHVTNAGWLNPFLDGDYLGDAQQTLNYYFLKYSIPFQESNFFNRLCAYTVIGTKIWMLLAKWGLFSVKLDSIVEKRIEDSARKRSSFPVSYEYLDQIRKTCEVNGAKFLLFVVKEHTRLEQDIAKEMPLLFKNLSFFECKSLLRSDYHEWPDGHFNNKGHKKFATCLMEQLN